jgi:hypothetical protein
MRDTTLQQAARVYCNRLGIKILGYSADLFEYAKTFMRLIVSVPTVYKVQVEVNEGIYLSSLRYSPAQKVSGRSSRTTKSSTFEAMIPPQLCDESSTKYAS